MSNRFTLTSTATEKPYPPRRWPVALAGFCFMFILGTVYAWSVFKKPLMEAHGWSAGEATAAFQLVILFLGLSAALGGRFVDRFGSRRVALISALAFSLATALAGLADSLGSRWLLWLGYGVLGGVGNGLGYIIPVVLLVRWFPDKKGLVTGLAIMGFGLGAAVMGKAAPQLIPTLGIANTFYLSAAIALVIMLMAVAFLVNPPAGWAVQTPTAPARPAAAPISVDFAAARRMPQFYLLWLILFINISAGIALVCNLSPLAQSQAGLSAAEAGTLVFVCSLFNGLGRLFWAAISDRIGRRSAFLFILGSQAPLFLLLPYVHGAVAFCVLASYIFMCYGGGFAVMPAFAAETFGPAHMGGIYGKLLLAWGLGGILGPLNMEFAGSVPRALAISGAALAIGFGLALGYRKPAPALQGGAEFTPPRREVAPGVTPAATLLSNRARWSPARHSPN